jgi:predicted O-methyltransferase YrrM
MVPASLDNRPGQYAVERRNTLLAEIIASGLVQDRSGRALALHSHVSRSEANALYETIRANAPELVVEIGMAFGTTSLAILTALEDNGHGMLISLDPNQTRGEWRGAGLENVRRAGLEHRHTLLERPSYVALPEMLGRTIDFAYIDGWHTVEYVMVDVFYLDKMLRAGGVLGFNDAGWRPVHKVIRFLQRHRRYDEMEVGLPRVYAADNPLISLARRLYDAPTQDRYFRKRERWEPRWDFYREF